MRIRSFIIAYALVLAILLFADRRPGSIQQDHYSHVVDLTDSPNAASLHGAATESRTRIIAPDALIPGTWASGQIPAERLVAPLVVMDLNVSLTPNGSPQLSLDDIADWETRHGMIPQGAVVAIRRVGNPVYAAKNDVSGAPFPVTRDAAMFLMEARYTTGFAAETPVDFTPDRTLARQIAIHGSYVVEGAAPFASLPATGSLVIVAPARIVPTRTKTGDAPVRILAMVR